MSSTAGGPNPVKEVVVDEYPAGKFKVAHTLEDGGLNMEALPDQGKLLFQRFKDTDKLEFVWKKATGLGAPEVTGIPLGSTFERIDTGNKVDRVYLLSNNRTETFRHFFWLQERDKSKDQGFVEAVQRCLRDPAAAPVVRTLTNIDQTMERILASFQGAQTSTAEAGAGAQGRFTNLLPNVGQQLGAQQERTGQISSSDMQAALAGVSQSMQSMRQAPLNLFALLNSEEVRSLLDDQKVQEELISFLPPEMQSPEELRHTLTSPQFRQAVGALSGALQSENFATVFANFGLDPRDGASALNMGDGIRAFLLALQAKVNRENGNNEDSMEEDEFYN